MALRLAEIEPREYSFCCTPTGRELPDMVEHWKKLECLLKSKVVNVPAPTLLELILKYRTLPNWRMRFCTRETKIEPFMAYAESLAPGRVLCRHPGRRGGGERRNGLERG